MAVAAYLSAAVILAFGVMAGSCQDGGGTTADSGIEGIVTIGPMCPVEREDTPCPDQPYRARIDVVDASGDQVATFESGEDGRFHLALEPGHYTLEPRSPNGSAPPYAAPVEVDVRAGAYTHVDISFDSGIR